MVWGKAGSTTLTETSDTIDCTTTTSSKFNMFIAHEIGSGNINSRFRINSDSSTSVYADRTSINFGSDTERSPNSDGWITAEVNLANNSDDKFIVGYYCDISGEEKLFMGCNCDRHDADNTAVERVDFAAKYVPSPNASITTFGAYNGNSGSYASGSNVSVLGSEITPAAAIPALDNVQDNSLFIDKVNANRYWFDKAPVVTDDLTTDKGWVSNTSDWTYNATGDYIDFATIRRSTTAQQIYIDVQDSDYLGSGNNISDSAWTANFKVKTGTSASGNAMIYLGFSNNLADSGTTQQSATMKMNMSSSEGSISLSVSRGNFETSSSPVRENADIYSSGNIPYSTDFYMTMTRSGDVFTLKAYSDSARTTQVGVTATVTVTGISALRYIKAFNDSEQTQSYTSTGARLYDMEIINGTDTWTWSNPKPIGRAIFASGVSPSTNVIDYITIATTGNATDFGDSLKSGHDGSAVGSILKAVFGGGTGTTTDTKLEYISFQTLGNAVGFGAMTSIGGNSGACGDGTRGIWGQNTAMEYITIDTPATSISFGTLGNNHGSDPASCADSTRGLWGGGEPSSDTNAMSYVTIQTLGNSTDFGDLTVARRQFAAVADATRGCFAGGYSGSYQNTIDYVTIQTPSNASDFGDLTQARVTTQGGAGDATRGCYGGGDTGGGSGAQNTIDYITFATTGNATDFGNLTVSRSRANGASDYVK